MFKNQASQGFYVYAVDITTGLGKTGDAANITCNISLDGGANAGTDDTNPTEIGGGVYWFDTTQAETNANEIAATPSSTTTGIRLGPVTIRPYASDLYHADIHLDLDGSNTQDEYTATWFKNGIRVTSGITSPVVQVVKRVDGTDLIAAATAMSQIGSTGSYKKDEGTNRITAGEAVVAIVTATIDGSSRSFSRVLGRDRR